MKMIKIHKRNKNKFIIYKKNSITLFKVLFINNIYVSKRTIIKLIIKK